LTETVLDAINAKYRINSRAVNRGIGACCSAREAAIQQTLNF
jgi:hypothetical protein